jgi:tetratricopeptide (TPR) repeat protein
MRRPSVFPGAFGLRWCALILSFLLCIAGGAALRAQDAPAAQQNPVRAAAFKLFDEGKYEDALPLFQSLAAANPKDMAVQEALGGCLVAHSSSLPDVDARRKIRMEARQAFLNAKSLGDKSNYLNVMLTGIPEDGGDGTFSANKDADDAMRAAETAYGKGDLDGAIAGYQQALKFDPQNYAAMLFSGDVYYKKKDYDDAYVWYGKAVARDPNTETAYRYWGDALDAAGKRAEARDKFIEAIVASPYQTASWIGLRQWAQLEGVQLLQLKINSPNAVMTKTDGSVDITIDQNSIGKHDGTESWMLYEITRAAWTGDLFRQKFPNEKTYRHSLEEESAALGIVADTVSKNVESNKIKKEDLDPQIAALIKLKDEGLIEAYVLLGRPDAGIAQDYAVYRDAHRDKLIAYMNEYVAPAAK